MYVVLVKPAFRVHIAISRHACVNTTYAQDRCQPVLLVLLGMAKPRLVGLQNLTRGLQADPETRSTMKNGCVVNASVSKTACVRCGL